jgi:hypothetical protein
MASGPTYSKSKKYRERAQQIRTIAEDVRSDEDQAVLLEIADEFDTLALDADVPGGGRNPDPSDTSHRAPAL